MNWQTIPKSALSFREVEVVQLIAESHTAKEIARILHLSAKTVECHRQNICRKLRLDGFNVALLVRWAVLRRIITVESSP